MNFVYNLPVTYEDVLEAISGFIERLGKRLWRLHVSGSEIHQGQDAITIRIRGHYW